MTSAAEKGATADRIMDHTGHRSVAMVRVYTRRADAFASHAGDEEVALRVETRTIATLRWPVWSMMRSAVAPLSAALVTKPARSE